ncbi:tRNA N6-adenosine threonylcarbamoyltransferase [subsurface metagenome]
MSFEVQQAIIDVLIHKTLKAARDYRVKSIILGGGVVANNELRKQFNKKFKVLVPSKIFCTDNAVMIGITAFFHRTSIRPLKDIKAEANLKI